MKNQHNSKSGISRRKFITTLGLAAGVSTIVPVMPYYGTKKGINDRPSKARNHSLKKNLLKLGVLLPPSNIYPHMSENFIAGMTLYFEQNDNQAGGRKILLQKAPIGFGPNSAVKRSRALMETDDVDLMTGIVDMALNNELRNLFHNQHLFLIANQVGANIVRPNDYSPFVLHNSLENWQANWAMGNWAARNLGQKAFVAASFYESGYDALYAFNLGYENAGGEIVRTMVNNLPAENKNMDPLLQAIEMTQADVVFASYSGSEAIEFVQAYHRAGLDKQIPLLGSGFMVDETQLSAIGSSALGIKSCFPWSSNLNQTENKDFYTTYKKKNGRFPDSFALLGFETAQILSTAVDNVQGDIADTEAFREALISSKLKSPRGQLTINPNSQQITGPLYLREVKKQGTGMVNEVFEVMETCSRKEMSAIESGSGTKTGWLNPYLCA